MKITITAREAIDSGCWDRLCVLKGINAWAVNEGLMDENEKFELTMKDAEWLKLLIRLS